MAFRLRDAVHPIIARPDTPGWAIPESRLGCRPARRAVGGGNRLRDQELGIGSRGTEDGQLCQNAFQDMERSDTSMLTGPPGQDSHLLAFAPVLRTSLHPEEQRGTSVMPRLPAKRLW
jgi:hypothetical protein